MITNILSLTVSPFLGQDQLKNNSNISDNTAKFDLIYSDYQNINTRSSYSRDTLYPFPELNQFISKKEKEKIISDRLHHFNT